MIKVDQCRTSYFTVYTPSCLRVAVFALSGCAGRIDLVQSHEDYRRSNRNQAKELNDSKCAS